MDKKARVRYLLVLISCCLMAASSIGVYTNSVGVFYTKVSGDLGVGRGSFAFHATLSTLIMGLLCPFMAKLMRKYRFRPLVTAGSLLAAGSTVLMARADNVMTFNVLGALRGIGMTAFAMLAVTSIINNWFREKHGLAVGIAMSFSGVAGAVFSPLFNAIIESAGWRTAFLCMGIIGFALTVPGILLLEFRPEQAGLTAYGAEKRSADKAAAAPGGAAAAKLYMPALILLAVMTVLHTSVTGLAQHFPGMSEWMGYQASVGAAMVSAGMIGNIVSKLAIGTLSDRFGPFKACISMIIVNAAAMILLLPLRGCAPVIMYLIAFFYGTVYAVGAVGIPVLTRELFGKENYSSAYSIMTIFTSVGSASALTIIGLIYDYTGGYTAAIIGGTAIDAINLALLAALAQMHRRGAKARS